jgi:hypothetical protein
VAGSAGVPHGSRGARPNPLPGPGSRLACGINLLCGLHPQLAGSWLHEKVIPLVIGVAGGLSGDPRGMPSRSRTPSRDLRLLSSPGEGETRAWRSGSGRVLLFSPGVSRRQGGSCATDPIPAGSVRHKPGWPEVVVAPQPPSRPAGDGTAPVHYHIPAPRKRTSRTSLTTRPSRETLDIRASRCSVVPMSRVYTVTGVNDGEGGSGHPGPAAATLAATAVDADANNYYLCS